MSQKDDTLIFAAQIGSDVPVLDLHGQRCDVAERALDRFLDAQFRAKADVVKIIHGRGSGTLREMVQSILADHSQVRTFEESTRPDQVGAVTYAVLDL